MRSTHTPKKPRPARVRRADIRQLETRLSQGADDPTTLVAWARSLADEWLTASRTAEKNSLIGQSQRYQDIQQRSAAISRRVSQALRVAGRLIYAREYAQAQRVLRMASQEGTSRPVRPGSASVDELYREYLHTSDTGFHVWLGQNGLSEVLAALGVARVPGRG